MSDSAARKALARTAARLNRAGIAAGRLPALVLMTDDERGDPVSAARLLPAGSLIIVRGRERKRRSELVAQLKPLARQRRLRILVASDPELAQRCGLDGVHFPEARADEAVHWRVRQPRWLITVAVHSLRALGRSKGADAVFLAPVFATSSHIGREPLGSVRANAIVQQARVPVYALGGIDAGRALRLFGNHYAGIAAVSALAR